MTVVGTQRWASYLDFEETWQYLKLPKEPEGGQANLLRRYIDSACTQAQRRAGRPLCPTEFRERHDGWSGEYIQLRYSPFLELVLCREWESSEGFITLPESTPDEPVEGIQIDYATARIMRTFAGYSWPRPFFPGSRNIEVTYKAGFNPVPPDVWEATVELVEWKWRNTQQAVHTFALPGSSFNDEGGSPPSGLYPGIPNRIGDVFDGYRLTTIG